MRHRLELEHLEDRIVPASLTLQSQYTGIDSTTSGGYEPPDTQGAAGPSSVIETVNQQIDIFSPKSAGTVTQSADLNTFFFTNGGLPHLTVGAGNSEAQSDPFTIYDPQTQRFIVGNLDFEVDSSGNTVNDGQNALLLAVSKSSDPTTLTTSDWNFFEVNTTETGISLQDYTGNPGYNADALVVTLNSFDNTGNLAHTYVNAISMNSLVNGFPLTVGTNLFQTDYNGELLPRPAEMPDSKPGDPMWMTAAYQGGSFAGSANTVDVVKMTNVLSSTPTFNVTTLNVNPYYQAVPGQDPGGAIDAFGDSRMLQSALRNNLLVTTNEVSNAAGNLDNARWYAIDTSSGSPVLQQQGDITGGPNVYITYPGINIDPAGDIGMTYMQSGTAAGQFQSMYVTGRTSSDPVGTMENAILVKAGAANYNGNRQGDMSRVAIDPSDGSFWAFSQWSTSGAAPNWGTAIANFSLTPPINIVLHNAVEGQPLVNVPVATFLDNSGVPLSSYTATINWGDGTTSTGTVQPISGSTNTFTILGSHMYAEEGTYTLTVSVNNGITTIGPVSGPVLVADAPLLGFAQVINGQVGAFINNALVGIFTDTDQTNKGDPTEYTATVYWPGGGVSTGRIEHLFDNTFAVYANSPYSIATGGLSTVQVVVRDVGGASVTIDSTLSVPHNPAIPPLVPQYQADSGPVSVPYATMQDALTNLIKAEQLFVLAFYFGNQTEKLNAASNLMNAFSIYQKTVFQFDMQLPGSQPNSQLTVMS